jgi:hypothetical protein
LIDQIDEELIKWVRNTTGEDVIPSLAAPTDSDALSVNLYLLEVVDDPMRRSGAKLPNQPTLRYLVTTHAREPKDAHSLLAALLYAALESQEYEVDLEPVPSHLWSAFNIAPRPAFILQAPLPREWKGRPAKWVRQPEPDMESGAPVVPLYGLVLGPNDIPLMNARVDRQQRPFYAGGRPSRAQDEDLIGQSPQTRKNPGHPADRYTR